MRERQTGRGREGKRGGSFQDKYYISRLPAPSLCRRLDLARRCPVSPDLDLSHLLLPACPRPQRYLSAYYTQVEVPKQSRDGYENTPTLVGMADVFVNRIGYLWNTNVREKGSALIGDPGAVSFKHVNAPYTHPWSSTPRLPHGALATTRILPRTCAATGCIVRQ